MAGRKYIYSWNYVKYKEISSFIDSCRDAETGLKRLADRYILVHFHNHLKSIEIVKKDILFANNQISYPKIYEMVFIFCPDKKG